MNKFMNTKTRYKVTKQIEPKLIYEFSNKIDMNLTSKLISF